MKAATDKLANVILKKRTGTLTRSDVDQAIATTQVVFAHWEEIGLNDALNAEQPSLATSLKPFTPTLADVTSFRNQAAAQGVSVFSTSFTDDEVLRMLTLTQANIDAFVRNQQSIRITEANALQMLQSLRDGLAAQQSKRKVIGAALRIPIAATASPITDCAVLGIAFAVACAVGCIPCCPAADVLFLLDLLGLCPNN